MALLSSRNALAYSISFVVIFSKVIHSAKSLELHREGETAGFDKKTTSIKPGGMGVFSSLRRRHLLHPKTMFLPYVCIIVVGCILPGITTASNTTVHQLSWTALKFVRRNRTVLNLAQGTEQSGRILGVIGPSGCGKTTFLRVIASRIIPTEGGIQRVGANSLQLLRRSDISLMHQDDSFFSMLTVKETITLTAQLHQCMHNKPLNVSLVNNLLSQVGLQTVANSKVGSARGVRAGGLQNTDNDLLSGISGGERKRLALACQLIGHPAILLADEPTSGLDAFQAHQVVHLLREQSRATNSVVICAIHQPRSSIWSLFDDVMLLTADGRTAYHGTRAAAVSYFGSIGWQCPGETNPAEYLIDLVSLDTTSVDALKASQQRIDQLVNAFETRNNAAAKAHITHTAAGLAVRPAQHLEHRNRGVIDFLRRSSIRVCLLIGRSLKQVLRDSNTNIARTAVSMLLAGVISAVYGRPGCALSEVSVSSRINIIAQAVINVAMLSMIKTLQLFERKRGVVSRERGVDLYCAAEYLLSKVAVELPLDALVAAVRTCATIWLLLFCIF